jgi:U3 small nucleolar RNA-associated protein MPP10
LSSFAQRQLALKKQIEELELENVGKKDWTLMGEANSRSRPINSLLEEDLDFEHRQRVVPVITEEKVKSLEDLIRARILENRYDDVVRRRAFDDKPFLPSKLFELQDTKSAQSLAQIYEEEYTTSRAGGTVDDRDGKLKKEHDELEIMWEGISSKLDALCNAHFTPKAVRHSQTHPV